MPSTPMTGCLTTTAPAKVSFAAAITATTISGPVKKDKLFVWWNQEWNKEIRGNSFATCNPTDAEEAGDFSGYGAATTDQCGAGIPTIPAFAQAPGNPVKVANPDAAGLLIAQFYPSPNFSANQTPDQHQRFTTGQSHSPTS